MLIEYWMTAHCVLMTGWLCAEWMLNGYWLPSWPPTLSVVVCLLIVCCWLFRMWERECECECLECVSERERKLVVQSKFIALIASCLLRLFWSRIICACLITDCLCCWLFSNCECVNERERKLIVQSEFIALIASCLLRRAQNEFWFSNTMCTWHCMN